MHNKLPPLPVRIVVAILVVGTIGYFIFRSLNNNSSDSLTASGSIEAAIINIAPEMSGKVDKVLGEEGQPVLTGDPLLSLDSSLLTAQRAVASAQLDSAKAAVHTAQNGLATTRSQYQIILESALTQGKETRLEDWFSDPDIFEQPGWYYTRAEQIEAAQRQVEAAQAAVEDAQANLSTLTQTLDQAEYLKAEQRLLDARLAYEIAQTVNYRAQNSATGDVPKGLFNRTHCGTNQGYFVETAQLTNQIYKCSRDPQLGEAGSDLYHNAYDELVSAQNAYNDLLKTQSDDKILQARADVSVAQERYYTTLDFLRSLQTGEQSPSVTAAQGTLDQAEASIEQAQKAVDQAQANLDLIDTQLKKLTINAPMDGVILTRNVEVGEFVQPGAVALTMANLNELTITVYVPEDRYGEISLNQVADVMVDSFPDEIFSGVVVHIADQAEFTPRNVQTVEGRSSTVIAIKLKVTNGEGKLKIGMPADVTFK
ncbi:MAG: efflux RND transporter periplasmic adaptor subunit [Anaerolineales bacterium]|nr:efflux RND transporter periplasmic adaptor subunit [Anaerolineales bacterium]